MTFQTLYRKKKAKKTMKVLHNSHYFTACIQKIRSQKIGPSIIYLPVIGNFQYLGI